MVKSLVKSLGSSICGISLDPYDNSLFNQLNLSKKINSHNITDINDFNNLKILVNKFNPDIVFT